MEIAKRDQWPTNAEAAAHMRKRQQQNRQKKIPAEEWMKKKLRATRFKWSRQAQWGFRIFDFWCHELGVNLEVDGPTHNAEDDKNRDAILMKRSGIIVFRVGNFDEKEAALVIAQLERVEPWNNRREAMGLKPVR